MNVTAGVNLQFRRLDASQLCLTTSTVAVVNSGESRPVLELTLEVPDQTPCVADLNGDRVVDSSDIAGLGYWGQDDQAYDLDGDGLIDDVIAIVLGGWGSCPD